MGSSLDSGILVNCVVDFFKEREVSALRETSDTHGESHTCKKVVCSRQRQSVTMAQAFFAAAKAEIRRETWLSRVCLSVCLYLCLSVCFMLVACFKQQ